VLLRLQDEKSVRRSGILDQTESREFGVRGQKGSIDGALMVSKRVAHIHSFRGFRSERRMAAYFIKFMIVSTLILIGLGGFLLYDAVSQPTNSAVLEVIGGAVLVALGLTILYPQGQMAIRWLREVRTHSSRIL
jgi:hypothetical protein